MKMPDGNSVAERAYQSECTREANAIDAHRHEARKDYLAVLFALRRRGPDVDTLLDAFFDDPSYAIGNSMSELRAALCKRDTDEIGWVVLRAFERAAERLAESQSAQRWIENRAVEIEGDAHGY